MTWLYAGITELLVLALVVGIVWAVQQPWAKRVGHPVIFYGVVLIVAFFFFLHDCVFGFRGSC